MELSIYYFTLITSFSRERVTSLTLHTEKNKDKKWTHYVVMRYFRIPTYGQAAMAVILVTFGFASYLSTIVFLFFLVSLIPISL